MVRMSGLLALMAFSALVVSTFMNSLSAKACICNKTFENATNYRVWSVATQQFLTMKKVNENLSITFTGTGHEDGTASQGSSILKALCHSTMHATLWRYVFELHDNGTRKFCALNVTENNTFTVFEVSSNTVNKATSFVPVDFGGIGPFKALEVVGSGKCMAADISDGSLSLKACDQEKPHPGTILVLSKP